MIVGKGPPGGPFLRSKCLEGAEQKEVRCAGQRAPARAARAALGGVPSLGCELGTAPVPSAVRHVGACEGPLTHAMTWAGCSVVLEVTGDTITMSGGSDVGSRQSHGRWQVGWPCHSES